MIIESGSGDDLREVHHDEVFNRIDPVSRVVGATPSELAHRTRLTCSADIYSDRESQSEAHSGADRDITDMVSRHQVHGRRRKQLGSFQSTAIEHHLEESSVVTCGGEESRSAGEAGPRSLDVLPLGLHPRTVRSPRQAISEVVDRGKTTLFGRGQIEVRVAHVERSENTILDERIQRLSRCDLDHGPQDVGVVSINEMFPRLRGEGE